MRRGSACGWVASGSNRVLPDAALGAAGAHAARATAPVCAREGCRAGRRAQAAAHLSPSKARGRRLASSRAPCGSAAGPWGTAARLRAVAMSPCRQGGTPREAWGQERGWEGEGAGPGVEVGGLWMHSCNCILSFFSPGPSESNLGAGGAGGLTAARQWPPSVSEHRDMLGSWASPLPAVPGMSGAVGESRRVGRLSLAPLSERRRCRCRRPRRSLPRGTPCALAPGGLQCR